MSRILALDWDRDQVCVVSAQLGRQGVKIERALAWREDIDVTPDAAAEAGRRLRERLKEAGLGGGPVLVCLGRQRLILKEIRYPRVPDSEEPALVRFQAFKDLTDNAEDVVLDYQNLGPGPQGDQQAMAVIVRRDVLGAYQAMCRAAGLKLVGVTPRAIGMAGAAQRGAQNSGSNLVAVLTVGARWAELCIVRARTLLFARALATGAALVGEVKRSLAVFGGTQGRQAVPALYVAGDGDTVALREQLGTTLGLPVHALEPFVREDAANVAGAAPGAFASTAGMLHLWGQSQALPINLVRPKEARPVGQDARRRRLLVAALIGLVFLVGMGLAQLFLQSLRADRDHLVQKRTNQQERLQRLQEDVTEVAALKEWEHTSVRWLDELYDLSARMEQKEGFRVTRLGMTLTPRMDASAGGKKGAKDPHIGQIQLDGVVPADQDVRYALVDRLAGKLEADKHMKVRQGARETVDSTKKFKLSMDLTHQAVAEYAEMMPAEASKGGRR